MNKSDQLRKVAVIALTATAINQPAPAQAYSVDCAILLCLAGGWSHPSPECTVAKIEFIRRITPWPIEPPLQIWNCPLQASYSPENQTPMMRLFEVAGGGDSKPGSLFDNNIAIQASYKATDPQDEIAPLFQLAGSDDYSDENGTADVDISGPVFDFVRSIHVYNVNIRDGRDEGKCERSSNIRVGSYGIQGDFDWSRTIRDEIPSAFGPVTTSCATNIRAVFIDWRDYDGNYDSYRVDY